MNKIKLLSFIPYIIALSTGMLTICTTVFIYIRHRNKIYLYLSLLLYSMLTKLIYSIIEIYYKSFSLEHDFIFSFFKLIKASGFSVLIFMLPIFISYIMLVKLKLHGKIILAAVSLITFLNSMTGSFIDIQIPYHYIVINTIFVSVILYSIALMMFNFKNLADKRQKKIIFTFLILACIFLPLFIMDIVSGDTSIQLPVYFIIVTILGVIFSFFYLVPPLALSKQSSIEFLQNKYNITNREREIILLIQKGYSNNEICGKTSISQSTVEKHINSIYKKLEIKNRVQLVNLLQSGMQ